MKRSCRWMRRGLVHLMLLAPFAVCAEEGSDSSGFYAHVGMAVLKHQADEGYLRDGGTRSLRDRSLGFSLGGGYQFVPGLALDLAWIELDVERVSSVLSEQDVSGRGVRLALDASWAPHHVVGPYGRAGVWHWRADVRPGFGRSVRRLEGTDPMFEAGLRFGPRAPVNLDIGYGWYPMDRLDTRVISLGMRAHF